MFKQSLWLSTALIAGISGWWLGSQTNHSQAENASQVTQTIDKSVVLKAENESSGTAIQTPMPKVISALATDSQNYSTADQSEAIESTEATPEPAWLSEEHNPHALSMAEEVILNAESLGAWTMNDYNAVQALLPHMTAEEEFQFAQRLVSALNEGKIVPEVWPYF